MPDHASRSGGPVSSPEGDGFQSTREQWIDLEDRYVDLPAPAGQQPVRDRQPSDATAQDHR